MTESQKAFKTWFDVNYASYYGQQAPIAVKAAWQAAEAYGRKKALEEAIALFDNQEWDTRYLADTVAQELKELIK
jgi:hypothetical protein